ncbi:AMP-binding protein [Pseudoalteromonas viridis]|uniref:AMP-binding protein n=1 Tax=Pseudoalteromonas viridis TaxID=339617 RepID=A0ABX7V9S3_9GAMM|nr:AMP-binding protein [Pseudoalteromonas viridis]QTL37656.1 AMP-binding protein [Pseudoalteromonas viridis]
MRELLSRISHKLHEVVLASEQARWTRHAFQQQCDALAALVSELDGACIAFQMDNSPAWIAVDLVLSECNKVALPLPLFFTPAQCEHALSESGASWLFNDTELRNDTPFRTITVCECTLYVYRINSKATHYFAGTRKITFTSGSTGLPKGVCLSQTSMMQVARSLGQRLSLEKPRHLCLLPLAVLLENVAGVYAPLLSDGQIIVPSLKSLGYLGSQLQAPDKLLACISQFEPNTLILVPELLQLLVHACSQGWQAPKSLRFIAVGGARVDSHLLAQAITFGLPVFQGYGLSEAGSVVALNNVGGQLTGVGEVLPHLEYKIEQGQLFLKGPLFLGYLNGPEHSPQSWLATEDLASQDGRVLVINGRLKNQLILSSGRNVSPEWPESMLLAQPGVLQVVVFGDARAHLVALIYAASQLSDNQLSQLIIQTNDQLPDYARVASWHRLTQPLSAEAELMTSNGRPRRDAIARHYQTELNALYCICTETQALQPQTLLEKSI